MEINRIPPVSNQQSQLGQSTKSPEPYKYENSVEKKELANPFEKPSEKDMVKTVEGLNKMFEFTKTHIEFTYHEELEKYYVKIIDDTNNEIIKEIPSKKILDMVAEMGKALGILVDKKV